MATFRGFWFMSNNLTGTDSDDDMFGAGFTVIRRRSRELRGVARQRDD